MSDHQFVNKRLKEVAGRRMEECWDLLCLIVKVEPMGFQLWNKETLEANSMAKTNSIASDLSNHQNPYQSESISWWYGQIRRRNRQCNKVPLMVFYLLTRTYVLLSWIALKSVGHSHTHRAKSLSGSTCVFAFKMPCRKPHQYLPYTRDGELLYKEN